MTSEGPGLILLAISSNVGAFAASPYVTVMASNSRRDIRYVPESASSSITSSNSVSTSSGRCSTGSGSVIDATSSPDVASHALRRATLVKATDALTVAGEPVRFETAPRC